MNRIYILFFVLLVFSVGCSSSSKEVCYYGTAQPMYRQYVYPYYYTNRYVTRTTPVPVQAKSPQEAEKLYLFYREEHI